MLFLSAWQPAPQQHARLKIWAELPIKTRQLYMVQLATRATKIDHPKKDNRTLPLQMPKWRQESYC